MSVLTRPGSAHGLKVSAAESRIHVLAIIMPQIGRGQEVVLKKNLKGLPAGEGVGKHVAVGKFEGAARRQTAGESRYTHRGFAQAIGD